MYSEAFKYAVGETLEREGLFTVDTGGRTKYGITEAVWKKYGKRGWVDIADITVNDAQEVYHEQYWKALRLDSIADKFVAAELFDSAVNCGPVKAILFAQQAVNYVNASHGQLLEDGVIGNKTIVAINDLIMRGRKIALLYALNGEQYVHYRHLIRSAGKWDAYAAGWTKRLTVAKELL